MIFDKIHAARLTALADHLGSEEELKVGTFDFSVVLVDKVSITRVAGQGGKWYSNTQGWTCGTAGCAIGEASLMWPDQFKLSEKQFWADVRNDASEFFGLSYNEVDYLFNPGGDSGLTMKATRFEVADHIRKFLKEKALETSP